MPAAEGIVLMLESQFDADTIPEVAIPVSYTAHAADGTRLVDVYVPSYLASQFWISYTVNPAMLAPAQAPTKYIFFKLILDGECIVSWGIGEAEEWKGKTMWAFFRGEDHGGWRTVDKRAFFFRATGEDQDFDILAYRARGRRRACRQFDEMPPMGEQGFDLVNWGRLKEHHPQNFHQYALLDPLDQPYATFRYHPSSPTKLDAEVTVPPELDMSILDPEPSIPIENPPESELVRKQSVQTPTPLGTEQHITDTPPSSLRRRSGAKIKEWFGSISKRRATRSISPIHPFLSHKTSSASLS
ncbi:hypothetical protein KCU60_g9980, partial [Aureobasidium melanogenum]